MLYDFNFDCIWTTYMMEIKKKEMKYFTRQHRQLPVASTDLISINNSARLQHTLSFKRLSLSTFELIHPQQFKMTTSFDPNKAQNLVEVKHKDRSFPI